MKRQRQKRSRQVTSKGLKSALRDILVALLAGVLTELIHDYIKHEHDNRTTQITVIVARPQATSSYPIPPTFQART